MKIQVAGYYYSRNLGDAVLCDCVRWLLERNIHSADIRILDLSGRTEFQPAKVIPFNPESQKKWRREYYFFQKCSRYTPFDAEHYHESKVLSRCRDAIGEGVWEGADCCIFAGGQIMTDWLALEVTEIAQAFLNKGKNVYFIAAGLGPVCSPKIRKIYRDLFRNPRVRLITMRDHADFFNRYYQIPEEKKAVPAADCGLWANEVYRLCPNMNVNMNVEAHSERRDGKPVGVGFFYPSILPADRVLQFMQSLIRELEERHILWEAFTNGSGYDAGFGEYVLSTLSDVLPPAEMGRHRRELESIPEKPVDLVQKIGSFSGILSFRLHSHVIAASLGIPSVAFVWDDKLNDFFSMMGCPERALSIETTPEKVLEVFEGAQKDGWNRSRVLEEREHSIEMLLNAMQEDIGHFS